MEEKFELGILIYFIMLILFLYVSSILYSYFTIEMDYISYTLMVFGLLAFIIYFLYCVIFKIFKIWNLIILFILFFLYLSYYNAFDARVAMWGFYGGREGLFAIYSYYFIFLLASIFKNNNYKKIIIVLLTICGIFNVFYGCLQVFNIEYIFFIPVARNWASASGFLFNPDFMGAYMILLFGIWLSNYLFDNKNNIVRFLILNIFVLGIFLCGTMGSFFTMVILLFLSIFWGIIKFKNKIKYLFLKIFWLFISSICIFSFVSYNSNTNIKNDIINLNYEIKESFINGFEDHFGTGRIYIWKESFKYFPKYIWTGIGIDNFAYLGFADGTFIYDSENKDTVIYKAHNEFLQILVTEGIFTFLLYLLLHLLIIYLVLKKILKSKDYYNHNMILIYSLFLSYFGYLIQSFFNIRMILIAPIFFMISGFLVSTIVNYNNLKN